jgi:hypothetical protein
VAGNSERADHPADYHPIRYTATPAAHRLTNGDGNARAF